MQHEFDDDEHVESFRGRHAVPPVQCPPVQLNPVQHSPSYEQPSPDEPHTHDPPEQRMNPQQSALTEQLPDAPMQH